MHILNRIKNLIREDPLDLCLLGAVISVEALYLYLVLYYPEIILRIFPLLAEWEKWVPSL